MPLEQFEREQLRTPAAQYIAELEAALLPFAKMADEIEQVARESGSDLDGVVTGARWPECSEARRLLTGNE